MKILLTNNASVIRTAIAYSLFDERGAMIVDMPNIC